MGWRAGSSPPNNFVLLNQSRLRRLSFAIAHLVLMIIMNYSLSDCDVSMLVLWKDGQQDWTTTIERDFNLAYCQTDLLDRYPITAVEFSTITSKSMYLKSAVQCTPQTSALAERVLV
jgi:hypothetical protein